MYYNPHEILNLSRPSYSGTASGVFAYARPELQLPPTFIYSLKPKKLFCITKMSILFLLAFSLFLW